jgi:Protein of unknown function (DUF3617)
MRNKTLCGLVLLATVTLGATDKIRPLNIKFGLWEMTGTTTRTAAIPVPEEDVSKLTPEQRARLQERMDARSAAKTSTRTYRSCLTKEKWDKDLARVGEDREHCTEAILTSTGSKISIEVQCVEEATKSRIHLEYQAISSETMKGFAHTTVTNHDHTTNIDSTYTAKWIGPVCGEVK